ncbi:PEFG-CTERM sorting domain-containing protein [Candidatus Nitrosopumilus sp. SW]|uniref:PEFG-CTERM sorting domain-containing protein n=1 Tax=Candidatus Nitrosopumilus sp. SW TaxID=2508726 RepID=UPI001151A63C|nr:PEFG-CTERM sorting domain-containing protein [Candidatus Nitrosopumilus sp. SW]QDI88042.1 PEFG-CTERM sorting domain-containing protein [Candidatus Nitrosopumilus sp. SW]
MKVALAVLPLIAMLIVGSGFAFAASYDIKIPSGASDENYPYFWSQKDTGVTTGEITVFPGDTITWSNADTAFHTITSVSASSIETGDFEEDGLFDSGFFTAGKSYTRQFNDLGDFYYYCSLHPWMNGVVHVVLDPGSVKSIDRIASGFSDDGVGFEVKYFLDAYLANTVHVDPDERTLTFTLTGESNNDEITITLPKELIDNPTTVWVNGNMVDFESDSTISGNTATQLVIPIDKDSREIKIMGSKVIPEFGGIALLILTVSIISIIIFSKKTSLLTMR